FSDDDLIYTDDADLDVVREFENALRVAIERAASPEDAARTIARSILYTVGSKGVMNRHEVAAANMLCERLQAAGVEAKAVGNEVHFELSGLTLGRREAAVRIMEDFMREQKEAAEARKQAQK